MKNLFLCSSFADVANLLPNFLEKLNLDSIKTVSFIDVASHVEEYKGYVENAKLAFERQSLNLEIIDFNLSSNDIIHHLQKNDLIYISGGNTFYLLQMLNDKKLTNVIIDLINNGKPYIGESAGSILLSKNIEYIKNMDNPQVAPNLINYKSLNIIDFYPVPHFENQPFKDLADEVISEYGNSIPLIAFNNNQALWVLGQTIILKNNG